MAHTLFLLLVAGVGWSGCGGGGSDGESAPTGPTGGTGSEQGTTRPRSQEDARRELGELGVQFDKESFVKAIVNGDVLAVSLFVDAGMSVAADIDSVSSSPGTPLMFAAAAGQIAVMEVLLDKGADVNGRTRGGEGEGALSWAVQGGQTESVRFLLTHGAKLDDGISLRWAVEKGHTEIVRLLLEAGADPNEPSGAPLQEAVRRGNATIVQMLLAAGARSDDQMLLQAATDDRRAIVLALLDAGAPINASDDQGRTVLMFAAARADTQLVQSLLGKGADINATALTGGWVLLFAVRIGDYELVRRALDAGVEPSATAEGKMALNEAILDEYTQLAELMVARGAVVDTTDQRINKLFFIYIENWDTAGVRQLLEAGVSPDTRGGTNNEPALIQAWYAAFFTYPPGYYRNVSVLQLLLEFGAYPDAVWQQRRENSITLLMIASEYPSVEVVRMLLEAGANPNQASTFRDVDSPGGYTSLMRAARASDEETYIEVARLLLDAGADVNARTEGGTTALGYAIGEGRMQMADFLRDRGGVE